MIFFSWRRTTTKRRFKFLAGGGIFSFSTISIKKLLSRLIQHYFSALIVSQYRIIAAHIQEAFNILIKAPQVLITPVEPRKIRNEPPSQFENPIRGVQQEVRRFGRPRLHVRLQPRAINHRAAVPRIAHRVGDGGRAAQRGRGARNARRGNIRQAAAPLNEPENLDPAMEVELVDQRDDGGQAAAPLAEPDNLDPEMHIDCACPGRWSWKHA
jgi:hypothetical protein